MYVKSLTLLVTNNQHLDVLAKAFTLFLTLS